MCKYLFENKQHINLLLHLAWICRKSSQHSIVMTCKKRMRIEKTKDRTLCPHGSSVHRRSSIAPILIVMISIGTSAGSIQADFFSSTLLDALGGLPREIRSILCDDIVTRREAFWRPRPRVPRLAVGVVVHHIDALK